MPGAEHHDPRMSGPSEVRPKAPALLQQELQMCDERIKAAEKASSRHGIFALLGASPATLLPMLGVGIDFGPMALLAASACVVGLEGWRYFRAQAEVRDALEERARLTAAVDEDRSFSGPRKTLLSRPVQTPESTPRTRQ